MSVILMTTLFYKALILQGEIWYWSLSGLKCLSGGCISLQLVHPNVLQQILQYLVSLKVDIYIFKHIMQQTRIQWCFFFSEYDQTPKNTALRPCKNLVSHRIPSVVCLLAGSSRRGEGGGRQHLLVFKVIDAILTLTCRCTITVIFIQDTSISWPRGLSAAGWVAFLSCLSS